MHLALEKNPKTLEFWRAMIVVAEDALSKMKENDKRMQEGGFPISVNKDIQRILSGKTFSQLSVLQAQILQKLSSNEPVDVEYWENLLKELIVYKAKAKLNDMHQEILATRLQQLRNKQREEALKVQEELERVLSMQGTEVHGQGVGAGEGIEAEPVDEALMEAQDQQFMKESTGAVKKPSGGLLLEEYSRSMSPEPMHSLSREDSELEIVDPAEDLKELVKFMNMKPIVEWILNIFFFKKKLDGKTTCCIEQYDYYQKTQARSRSGRRKSAREGRIDCILGLV